MIHTLNTNKCLLTVVVVADVEHFLLLNLRQRSGCPSLELDHCSLFRSFFVSLNSGGERRGEREDFQITNTSFSRSLLNSRQRIKDSKEKILRKKKIKKFFTNFFYENIKV